MRARPLGKAGAEAKPSVDCNSAGGMPVLREKIPQPARIQQHDEQYYSTCTSGQVFDCQSRANEPSAGGEQTVTELLLLTIATG